MREARMTSKGPITLPKKIRDRLGPRKGDRVRFMLVDDGRVRLLPENVQTAAAREDLRRGAAEFADCLLARGNPSSGCSRTRTFDRAAARPPGFEPLEA